MEKKIIRKVSLELTKEEKSCIDKTEDLLSAILGIMDVENLDILILEYYDVILNYSKETLEEFREFLEYLSCSDNEVV